jgi:hypothetical protein
VPDIGFNKIDVAKIDNSIKKKSKSCGNFMKIFPILVRYLTASRYKNKKASEKSRALKNIPYFDQVYFLDNKKTLITGFKNIRSKRFSFYNYFLFEVICVDFLFV